VKNAKVLITAAIIVSTGISASSVYAERRSIPSVIVTVENAAPARGAFQTPFWVGIHGGGFDIYDRNVALGGPGLVPAAAVERLAEDGNTGPISAAFTASQPSSPQATLTGPSGPFAPNESSSRTLNVDTARDRFFSYASMVVPSNDAFIANGSATAHELFNAEGRFVGSNFVVTGSEVLDAGTEVNDEIAANTAFLAQAGPNVGVTQANGVVVIHPGLRTDRSFPNGVLNYPPLANSNFGAASYRVANVSFRFVDLGRRTRFISQLSASNQVGAAEIVSDGRGIARAVSRRGERLNLRVRFSNLSGPVTAAHLHNAADGENGPVVVNLTTSISGNRVIARLRASDVTGSLATGGIDPMVNLLNEMAAGNIYINLHTAANPGGEIRGQVSLR
jgi:hypothetical protein